VCVYRFLQRLLLIHGQWSYARQARLIFYQFYVQLLYNTLLFYYQFSTAFTQQVRRPVTPTHIHTPSHREKEREVGSLL
jgi:magnesium-transporting ATPase (P-type)